MFSLTELHAADGNAIVDSNNTIEIPIGHVGALLDWKLEKVFQDDVLIFNQPGVRLFPHGGDLHIRVIGGEGTEFSWQAKRYILHVWPKESV